MLHRMINRLHALYHGDSKRAHRFRYALLLLDFATIVFLVVATFFPETLVIQLFEIVFGLYLLLDYLARLWIARRKFSFLIHPMNLADAVAMLSFLAPVLAGNFAFLRALRVLRLLRSYRLLARLRTDFSYFHRNEDVIVSATHLMIFIFLMTELVYVTQHRDNPAVGNFLDAMYFTIAALTTTGFGDITLSGTAGRALSVIIMIFGVSLFLRLIQTVFRPTKVRHICRSCGLFLHDIDAVHCKHCGAPLTIPTTGVL